MRRAALLLLSLLSACGDMPQARTESEIREIARQVYIEQQGALNSRVGSLEERMTAAEQGISGVRALGLENAENAQRLHDTFNHNVQLDNEASARAMTARGACGQETYVDAYNVTRLRNKECTVADLR